MTAPSPELLDSAIDPTRASPADILVTTAPADGPPVGYLLAVPGDGTVYVAELVVAPDHRREGRARALLEACAADAEQVTVTVEPDNEAAQSLYRRCGFERVERLPEFFENGDAVLYRRDQSAAAN
nr:N-acetyltransferase [Haloplanus sp. XH21]